MHSLGQDIIQMYKPYKNKQYNTNTQIISGQKFEIDDRYEIIQKIGQGAYGMVVAAKDKKNSDNLVAIKKISKAFEHKIVTKRTLRQLKMLRLLKQQFIHQNIVEIQTILLPKSREQFNDIYVVSQLMDTDLASVIKSDQQLTEKHIKFFMYQLIRGLKYLHTSNVIHRDLKPRNLLISSKCDLKICDFGLARTVIPNVYLKKDQMTNYVITRWYRAPQLLLNVTEYTKEVDIWSVGCIFGELLKRKPILKGRDTTHQLQLICQKIGSSNIQQLDFVSQENKKYLKKMIIDQKVNDLSKTFPELSPQALDLLRKLLKFNPKQRITSQQALEHPYFEQLHNKEDEPLGNCLNAQQFEFEYNNLTTQQLKDLIYEEILLYHYKGFRTEYENKKKNNQSLIKHVINNSNSKNINPITDLDEY